MKQNLIKVQKIGSTPEKINLPESKNPLMFSYQLQYDGSIYIIASSIDGYLFCFRPNSSSKNKETFFTNTGLPITSCIYLPEKRYLFCGDISGQLHLFHKFPSKQFLKYSNVNIQIPEEIDNYFVGMYVDVDKIVSVHGSREVKSWKVDEGVLACEEQEPISRRPYVLIPVQNHVFNLIIAVQEFNKPFILKNIRYLKSQIESLNDQPIQVPNQITDLCYNKQSNQVIAGFINGQINVFSVSEKDGRFLCSTLTKFYNGSDRIIKIRMFGPYVLVLCQTKILQVHLKQKRFITVKENQKIGLMEVCEDALVLGNVYDPLSIPEIKFQFGAKVKILKFKDA